MHPAFKTLISLWCCF